MSAEGWDSMEEANNEGYDQGYRDGLAVLRAEVRREAAQDLMNKLRQRGVYDSDWDGGDVVEVVDTWLQNEGIDTTAVRCPVCGESIPNNPDAIRMHYAEQHPDDDPRADGLL